VMLILCEFLCSGASISQKMHEFSVRSSQKVSAFQCFCCFPSAALVSTASFSCQMTDGNMTKRTAKEQLRMHNLRRQRLSNSAKRAHRVQRTTLVARMWTHLKLQARALSAQDILDKWDDVSDDDAVVFQVVCQGLQCPTRV